MSSKKLFAELNSIKLWIDADRDKAEDFVMQRIEEQTKKLQETEMLIDHTKRFITARSQSKNKMGMTVTMRQLQKHESQQRRIQVSLQKLRELATEVVESDEPVDFETETQRILSSASAISIFINSAFQLHAMAKLSEEKPPPVRALSAPIYASAEQNRVGAFAA